MKIVDIEKSLKGYVNGACFITRSELAKAMNFKDPHSADKYLCGLAKTSGRYFIKEVAEKICEKAEYA